MAGGNVEVVQRALVEAGDLTELWDPRVRIDNFEESPIQGPYGGYEGLRRWRADTSDVMEDYSLESEEIVAVDADRVLAVLRIRGRARHSGIDVDLRWAAIYRLRDGRIVHAQGYRSPEAAFEAAGLDRSRTGR